jgi:hypothetical protein
LDSRAVEFETFSVASECRTFGAPPDFLSTLAALASFMRLSLTKAAHAVLGGATYRKSELGSSCIDVPALPGWADVWRPALRVLADPAMMSGLDIHYDLGEGHPLLGRRMPDLNLVTAHGPVGVFTLLHDARPVLLNLGEPGGFDITPWADRVQLIDAAFGGPWELPVIGTVAAPTAVLIRPDGYVAWVGDLSKAGLADALATWFGPPSL